MDAEEADLPLAGPDEDFVIDAADAKGRQSALGADDKVRHVRMAGFTLPLTCTCDGLAYRRALYAAFRGVTARRRWWQCSQEELGEDAEPALTDEVAGLGGVGSQRAANAGSTAAASAGKEEDDVEPDEEEGGGDVLEGGTAGGGGGSVAGMLHSSALSKAAEAAATAGKVVATALPNPGKAGAEAAGE